MKNTTTQPFLLPNYLLLVLFCSMFLATTQAQNVDLENILQGKALKINGSVSANSVYYTSSQQGGRDPFTYFLQGALNVSVFQFSVPISYRFTNQGNKLDYALPFKFNRLSLHPKYKWIQAHIGDVCCDTSVTLALA